MLSQRLPEFENIGEFSLEKLGCHKDEKNSELFCWMLDKQSNLCAAGTLHAQSDKVHTSHVSQFTKNIVN